MRNPSSEVDQDRWPVAQEELRQLYQAAGIGSFDWDVQAGLTHLSPELEALFGLPPGSFDSRYESWLKLVHPEDLPRVEPLMADAFARREPRHETEFRVVRPDGEVLWIEVRCRIFYDDADRPLRVLGVNVDITRRKQSESALEEREARLRRIIDCGMVGMMFWNSDGTVSGANDCFLRMLGYTREDLEAGRLHWPTMTPSEHSETDFRKLQEIITTGVSTPFEKEFFHRNGSRIPVLVAGAALDDQGHEGIGFVLDMTERKRSEAVLRDREELLRLAVDAGQFGIWDWDLIGERLTWSPEILALAGIGEREFDGTYRSFEKSLHPDDRRRVWEEIARSMTSTGEFRSEYRFVQPGGAVRWLVARGKFLYDLSGRPCRMIGICFDITERKRGETELREAAERAEAASQAKDQFLAVLSHELRTPLTPVLMTTATLAIDPDVPERLRAALTVIRRNVELEARLIDDLLDLTRISRGKIELQLGPVDIHEKLRHVVQNVEAEARSKRLSISLYMEAEHHRTSGDSARLQQILWNLLTNAVKFTPEGGHIDVRTSDGPDGRVRVEVSDDGIGIEPEMLPRIFNAFEQGGPDITRQFGGLGLGLSISKVLAELHGGLLSVTSGGRGQGSTFILELPLLAADADSGDPAASADAAGDGTSGRRILLVEDHEDTAAVLADFLRLRGYVVHTADSVGAAMRAVAAESYDLIISDLGLPDGSGHDLMRHLRAGAAVRGIALSGYGMEEDIRKSREAGFLEHLTKPVNPLRLEVVIARVLEEAAH
ncbi:MAG TPA: PAS domain-containing protein [Thermoanaerobaculia bacterium]|nr:PAS domain-containing protein [Thermoanaerobaculia bacterium]